MMLPPVSSMHPVVLDYFRRQLPEDISLADLNASLRKTCGIVGFFGDLEEFRVARETVPAVDDRPERNRAEYGDFQTNAALARRVVAFLKDNGVDPDYIIEPTCGKGNFLIAALDTFRNLKRLVGVEVYKPYTWEAKVEILNYFLCNPERKPPEIWIHPCNVFGFDFHQEAMGLHDKENVLVLGNPPWVTNALLGSLGSANLPPKSNFKKVSGLEAMTGKGNFDLGESVTTLMIEAFQKQSGHLAFLIKNSVVKMIVHDQPRNAYTIANLRKISIDSKKEFEASVEASLFFCRLNRPAEFCCEERSFNGNESALNRFGWVNGKFVASIDDYLVDSSVDGHSPLQWRQGVKHDLSSVMELVRSGEGYINGRSELIRLEDDLVFPLLKSSDLKGNVISDTRKFTIIPQKTVGEDTSFIESAYPQVSTYLQQNRALFDSRKSAIYKNKPSFSIFGIGDYSFAPYKVAISGLYKNYAFSLILPINDKAVMLDDTCYFLSFDNLDFAAYCYVLLNSSRTIAFLKSITFSDAKRTFTKDGLMRIDLLKLGLDFSPEELQRAVTKLNEAYGLKIQPGGWSAFIDLLKQHHERTAAKRIAL